MYICLTMIPILQAKQIKLVDEYTIMKNAITSIELMEIAAKKVFEAIKKDHPLSTKNILVVCGPGNNGGDGLAVARMLYNNNFKCKVLLVNEGQTSEENKTNEDLCRNIKEIEIKHISQTNIEYLNSVDFIIDALFGVGISRKPEGIYAQAILLMNSHKAPIISIDIPSGLYSDEHTNHNLVVKSIHTYTFQHPKLALMMPENEVSFSILDIGLDLFYMSQIPCSCYYIESADAKPGLVPLGKFSHKGDLGHALIIAGGSGKMGAAVMSAQACSKSGCGLITLIVPDFGVEILQISVPQAMTINRNEIENNTIKFDKNQYDSVGIGPGLGTEINTLKFFEEMLNNLNTPLVIDADALNILAQKPELMQNIPKNSILTPHPGEFKRLVGDWENDFEKLQKLKEFAKKIKGIVLLKGAHSIIAGPDGIVYFNSTGNSGMAKGGSGDVLTGILTGLLATGVEPINAAITGVYLHGASGNLAAELMGKRGMNATDIIDQIPKALLAIENN